MKPSLLIFTLLFFISAKSQDSLLIGLIPLVEGKANYTRVIDLPNKSKDDIYIKIKDWGLGVYKSTSALEADDKESGFLSYKGYFKIVQYLGVDSTPVKEAAKVANTYDVWHKLKFYIKDSKVKVVYTDINFINSYDKDKKYPMEEYLVLYTKESMVKENINPYAEKAAISTLSKTNMLIGAFINVLAEKLAKKSEFEF